jgi:uncharacterized protein (DUF1501 family)
MARFVLQNRRSFLATSAAATAGLSLNFGSRRATAAATEPHFFLHLFFPGGMDATYTFDARPLAMTAAKLQQNYIGKEPTAYAGVNGTRALRTELVNPVLPFLDRFSVLNGVVMAPDFDGHEDNQSVLLTGNPLGGSSFHGILGNILGTPVSAIIGGANMVSDNRVDTAGGVRLTAKNAKEMSKKLSSGSRLGSDQRLNQFFKRRFAVGPDESGSFAKSKVLMGQAISEIPGLSGAIASMEVPEVSGDTETVLDSVKLAASAFRSGFCRSALCAFNTDLSENQNLDAHDFNTALQQPRIISELMTELSGILKYLRETPYSEQQSLLDVTTVFITSEFGRTMRQYRFETSGSDHNALTNSMLIGGKGIKGGLVLGASDQASVAECEAGPGKAHLLLDPGKIKVMGRSFDFATQQPVMNPPEEFKLERYLSAGSVVNTIFSMFGVPQSEWRTPTRNGPPAELLTALLS